MGSLHKVSCTKVWPLCWWEALVRSLEVWAELAVFHWTPDLLEGTANRQTVVTQVWLFDRQLPENKLSKPVTSGHQLRAFVANDKIWTSEWKLENWKICVYYWELENFPMFKYFPEEISGDINKCAFKILCNEMCQCLVELYNSLKQIANTWYYNVWVKDPFKV